MDKRRFLQAASTAAWLPVATATHAASPARSAAPALLTVSGAIRQANRPPLDKALDQMMAKHGVAFDKGFAFGFAEIAALPAVEMRPTLEYDGLKHTLRGPTVARVLEAAGAIATDSTTIGLRAVDGYNAELTLGEIRRLGFIVATHIDGQPMPLGGLGPMWAVYEPDRFPDLARLSLPERFVKCPWGVYSIHVG
ncbi:molybdopterin-dependent oxidoreductase [uncultured Hydrogenophaga sp.]|uniref:molybdopterin-dependent oxidoreductase n=1 Tax=uncultured Hydrogenophaga sp. TaxID=199683 RepID=UPI00265E0BA1|nr:molybdopterin-dependent oxidoreductase [uncultured Hydrogenophaga sp.]